MTTAQCSRGWAGRCARAKGPRCTCQCGGENHGNPAARRRHDQGDMMGELTSHKVFEPVWECSECGQPLEDHPKHEEDWRPACITAEPRERDDKRFLVEPFDIEIRRVFPRGADTTNLLEGTVEVNVERRFIVHSPTGYEYGYGGSGPADLALNILGAFVPPVEAWRLHQDFKREWIAGLDRGPDGEHRHILNGQQIKEWINLAWYARVEEARERAARQTLDDEMRRQAAQEGW